MVQGLSHSSKMTPLGKLMSLILSSIALVFAVAGTVENSWLILTVDGAQQDHIGLFRHCTDVNDCCDPSTCGRRGCGG